jgi:hypothetical protein
MRFYNFSSSLLTNYFWVASDKGKEGKEFFFAIFDLYFFFSKNNMIKWSIFDAFILLKERNFDESDHEKFRQVE